MNTTASSFTLRKNAKRAAEAMIRNGTAPAVDYDINPSGRILNPHPGQGFVAGFSRIVSGVCRAPLAIGTGSRSGSGLRNGVSCPWVISRGASGSFHFFLLRDCL